LVKDFKSGSFKSKAFFYNEISVNLAQIQLKSEKKLELFSGNFLAIISASSIQTSSQGILLKNLCESSLKFQ